MSQRQVFKQNQFLRILLIALGSENGVKTSWSCPLMITWLRFFHWRSTESPLGIWEIKWTKTWDCWGSASPHLGRLYDEDGIRCGMKEFWVNVRLSPARREMTSPEGSLAQETRAAASLPITSTKNSPASRKQGNGLPTKTHEFDNSFNLNGSGHDDL